MVLPSEHLFSFAVVLRLIELDDDDYQGQFDEEECANEDDEHEVKRQRAVKRPLDVFHYRVGPAFGSVSTLGGRNTCSPLGWQSRLLT
jgi:hypothetical protein